MRNSIVIALFSVLALFAGCGKNVPKPVEQDEIDVNGELPVAGVEAQTSRFIVETHADQNIGHVESAAFAIFGPDSVVEKMFSGIDDPELDRFFIVHASKIETAQNPWDRAYEFEASGAFANVEPDQFDTLLSETERVRQATGACLFEGEDAPDDKAWSLRKINVAEAWDLTPPAGGKRFGEGARICHPDTGWTLHDDLNGLDLDTAWNVIDDSDNARDPKNSGAFLNPGHGTATGSVIISDGGIDPVSGTTPPGEITGVAPGATLVPIRTVNSVVQLFDSDVAQAVAHSVDAQCDVVSMSLGGRAFSGLKSAVRYAADKNLIIVAAAGNCVGVVVAPAAYKDSVAVAATNIDDEPWKGSSRGRAVTIAAPGENVWNANNRADPDTPQAVGPGNGTSFATAEVAGAAALWLAYHGRDAVELAAGGDRVQDLFVEIMQETALVPNGWNDRRYGAGILDVKGLLEANLTTTRAAGPPPTAAIFSDTVELLANVIDREPEDVDHALRVMFDDASDFEAALEQMGPELIDVAIRNPTAFEKSLDAALLTSPGTRDPAARESARRSIDGLVSQALRDAIR